MTSVVAMRLAWREDQVTDGGRPEDILENAPERQGDYFVVPKVVE
jgi:aspartyl-tRNA(Asn)/glutamyl-tRNA(Gln) amidotransferase subunit C